MILLIDNYDSFTYNLYQLLTKSGQSTEVVRNDQITLAEVVAKNPQGIVLSPGPGRPEQAGICVDLIQQLANRIPLLGVCLGHQAIGCAFGGQVIGASEIVHGKVCDIYHNQFGIFKNLPEPFKATRYHSLCLAPESLPAELQITAKTHHGLIMGIQHQYFPCFGVQFHPESIASEAGEQLLGNFLEICKDVAC